jgi:small-conductance mechanosensitive channel
MEVDSKFDGPRLVRFCFSNAQEIELASCSRRCLPPAHDRLLVPIRCTPASLARACFLALCMLLASPTATPAAENSNPQDRTGTVSSEDIERLINVLQNDAARAQLIDGLREAARKASPSAEPSNAQAAAQPPATRFLLSLGNAVTGLGATLADAGRFVEDFPRVYRWIVRELSDPQSRQEFFLGIGSILSILATGAATEFATLLLCRGWRRRLETRPAAAYWRRVARAALHLCVNLLPILAFWLAAMAMVAAIRPDTTSTVIAVALVNAHVAAAALTLIPLTVLAPLAPRIRLVPLEDAAASRLLSALRSVFRIAAYGYFATVAVSALGLPGRIYTFLMKALGVGIAAMLTTLVWQFRPVPPEAPADKAPPPAAAAAPRRHRWRRHAQTWHWPALAYIGVALLLWLTRGSEGLLFLFRATALTAIIGALLAAVAFALQQVLHRLLARTGRLHQRNASLGSRVRLYVQALSWFIIAAIAGIAILAVAEAWGVPAMEWLTAVGGERIIASLISIGVIVAVGVVAWEALNLAAERLIRSDDGSIDGLRRAARLRTLLPLFRRASLSVLAVFVVLISLSEIGINIGPLLAGAGVVGVAVGFGAQALVKDIFGGISALVEDSIAVGDIVQVAGKGGVVEWMSLRSLRLRDFDGTVHIVPFSEITSVSNMTKHFAFAVLRIGVSYKTDVPKAQQAIRDVVTRMRNDPEYGPMIWDDVELHGVESFGDSAVVLLARIKVGPAKQWSVSRQFHVWLKEEFDRQGIEIPFPQRTITFAPGHPPGRADEPAGLQRDRRAQASA